VLLTEETDSRTDRESGREREKEGAKYQPKCDKIRYALHFTCSVS